MKQQRKADAATSADGMTAGDDDEAAVANATTSNKSRKERQKLAKELERKERLLLQQERAQVQQQEQLKAQERKQQRLLVKQHEKHLAQEIQAQEAIKQQERFEEEQNTFLRGVARTSSSNDTAMIMTVQEFQSLCSEHTSVDLMALSEQYRVPLEQIHKRIHTLVESGRLTGILRHHGTIFYSFSSKDVASSILKHLDKHQEATWSDIATVLASTAQ